MNAAGGEGKALVMGTRVLRESDAETETFGVYLEHIFTAPPDPTTEQTLKIIEASGSLDFWDRPEEDIYSLDDGQPI